MRLFQAFPRWLTLASPLNWGTWRTLVSCGSLLGEATSSPSPRRSPVRTDPLFDVGERSPPWLPVGPTAQKHGLSSSSESPRQSSVVSGSLPELPC